MVVATYRDQKEMVRMMVEAIKVAK